MTRYGRDVRNALVTFLVKIRFLSLGKGSGNIRIFETKIPFGRDDDECTGINFEKTVGKRLEAEFIGTIMYRIIDR